MTGGGIDSASCSAPASTHLLLPTAALPCLQRNEEAAKEGAPLQLFWRRQYVPTEGMFCDPPAEMQLGTRLPEVRVALRLLHLHLLGLLVGLQLLGLVLLVLLVLPG